MTKRDYIAVAEVFRASYLAVENIPEMQTGIDVVVGNFIAYAKSQNPRFNEDIFRAAIR